MVDMKGNVFTTIRAFVKTIPYGKVVTYGDVAKAIGIRDARKVGWALHGNTDPTSRAIAG